MRPTQRKYLPDHVVINRPHVTYLVDYDEYIQANVMCDHIPSNGYIEHMNRFTEQIEKVLSIHKINTNIKNLLED